MAVIRKTISVPEELFEQADSIRKSTGRSFSRFALEAIQEKLDREKEEALGRAYDLAAEEYQNNPEFREESRLWDSLSADGLDD
jgi:uncharacterized Zn finger protein